MNHNGTRRRPRRPAALVALSVLAALAAAGCGERDKPEAERTAPPASADQAPKPAYEAPSRAAALVDAKAANPARITIPRIGVSAKVIPLRLAKGGALETPKDYRETGWSVGGPEPGEKGAAVIAGHVDSKTGPAVFYRLESLSRGDTIRVKRADGSEATFAVTGRERHRKAAFPTRKVYTRTQKSVLRLVTCSGDFDASSGHYVDNTIVFATRTG